MKKSIFFAALFLGVAASAQYVGVNTSTPEATLDVTAKNPTSATETQIDGVLVPRVNAARAESMGTTVPNATLIFVNDITAPATINTTSLVTTIGFYYFDSTQSKWIPVSGNDWHITGNSDTDPANGNFLGTINDKSLEFKVNSVKSGWIGNSTDTNTGLGYNTMTGSSFSTAGSARNNVAIGRNTLAAATSAFTWSNIAIGNNVLSKATDPRYNTAIGDNSQANITTGRNNVSLGVSTLANATNAGINTAIGGSSMGSVTTGSGNSSLGLASLGGLTIGHGNIALGYLTGNALIDGNHNIIIGGVNVQVPDPHGNQQLNIGDLITGTGLSTGTFATNPGTTSYTNKRVGIAVTSQPNSTLQVNGSMSANIRSLASGTVADTDYTVLVEGNVSLPAADATNIGRIYNLIQNAAGSYTVSGSFRINGGNFSNYGLNGSTNGTGFTVQSNGAQWVIISRY